MANAKNPILLTIVDSSLGELDWILPVLVRLKEREPNIDQVILFLRPVHYQSVVDSPFLSQVLLSIGKPVLDTPPDPIADIDPQRVKWILRDDNPPFASPRKGFYESLCPNAKKVVYPCSTVMLSLRTDTNELVERFENYFAEAFKQPKNAAYGEHDLAICGSDHDLPLLRRRFDESRVRIVGYPRYDKWWIDRLLSSPEISQSEEKQITQGYSKKVLFVMRGARWPYLNEEDYKYLISSVIEVANDYDDLLLLMKPHPRQKHEQVIEELNALNPRNAGISSLPLLSLASMVDLTVSVFSSGVLDSLALDKRTIEFYRYKDVGAPELEFRKCADGTLESLYCTLGLVPKISKKEDLQQAIASYFTDPASHMEDHRRRVAAFNELRGAGIASDRAVDEIVKLYDEGKATFSLQRGAPTTRVIRYGEQLIEQDDISEVTSTLTSDYLTTGPKVAEFEHALGKLTDARVVACSNGTAALHLAALCLNLQPGALALVPAITFVASANCIEMVGGRVDFIDIDPKTKNISVEAVERYCQHIAVPSVVVAVDFAGVPCDLPSLRVLADKWGFKIIEDAAHSIGSTYRSNGQVYHCGDSNLADLSTYSFHPVKNITTGEGGAVLVRDENYERNLRMLVSHGITRDKSRMGYNHRTDTDAWYYEMQTLGFNYRLTEIQSALGLSQLRKLEKWKERRRAIYDFYITALAGIDEIVLPELPDNVDPCFHLFVIQLREGAKRRAQVYHHLLANGVQTQVHYIPVYWQPYYQKKYAFATGKCMNAENYYQGCLSLPMHVRLTNSEVERIVALIKLSLAK